MNYQSDAHNLLKTFVAFETETRDIYHRYLKGTTNPGLRHLLTIINQGLCDHEKEIQQLIEEYDIDLVFDLDEELTPALFRQKSAYTDSSNFNDVMHTIMQREKTAMDFLSKLSSSCRNKEISFLLTRLACEEKKYHNWAVDQYELELLSE